MQYSLSSSYAWQGFCPGKRTITLYCSAEAENINISCFLHQLKECSRKHSVWPTGRCRAKNDSTSKMIALMRSL